MSPAHGRVAEIHRRKITWLIHSDPDGLGTVALASMEDGTYLSSPFKLTMDKVPYYWNLTEVDHNIYTGPDKGWPTGITDNDWIHWGSHLREATPESCGILSTGAIGPYAYPEGAIYYTVDTPGQVTIMNHMDTDIYATVSGNTEDVAQFRWGPGLSRSWKRDKDESAHVSMVGSLDGQSAQVFTAYHGKILHIQKMPSEPVWQGIKSIPVEDAKYSPHEPGKEGYIGVQNDLAFQIYVAIFSSVHGGDTGGCTGQYAIKPNSKDSWYRTRSEIVFVSVGSSPGAPRAYIGRPGFILHIDTMQ
ncbi:hypothetical protein D9611_013850 [Ephemerocybe angulata]|uniref:Uncharacterized protein n=1 Tax=Ephemerocybe angulata TaxID=980116 RepID=A0A8H5BTP4_9AGAR|nr:hypothetical protein D9611_013850 [Tulosesus angulatus]